MTRRHRLLALAAAGLLAATLTACSSTTGSGSGSGSGTTDDGGASQQLAALDIIAPAAPGSGWDQTARAVQNALQTEELAARATVTNVPGASGTVALAQFAARQGQSDVLIASGLAMMSGVITNATDVTLDDLTPLARVVGEYEALVLPKDSPYTSTEELFAAIKDDPKSVAIAGGSAGSADHIFIGLLAQHYGVEPSSVNYVPFSGGGEATTALLGNKVQAGIAGVSEFAEQIKAGGLQGLMISAATNESGLEFVDTATDIDPALEFTNWRSIMAPAGIDDALRDQYIDALDTMHASATWTEALATNGWVDNYLSGDEFATWLGEENTRVDGVLGDLGLKP